MTESPVEKILRLAGGTTKGYIRSERGRPQNVRAYPTPHPAQSQNQMNSNNAAAQLRFGTPYRSSWNNVAIGDVLEFGRELWKVIPATSYPGYKPGTSTTGQTSTGTGSATGGSTTGVSSGTGTGSTVPQTYTNYLQNLRNTREYDQLTLPSTFVVTIVPTLP